MLTVTEIAGFAGAGLAGAAYIPQISHLIRARCSAGVSRLAFEVWLLASVLTTARAIAIHAGVFIVLGGIQIVATALIMVCATRYTGQALPGPSARRARGQDGHRDGQPGKRAWFRGGGPAARLRPQPHRPGTAGHGARYVPVLRRAWPCGHRISNHASGGDDMSCISGRCRRGGTGPGRRRGR